MKAICFYFQVHQPYRLRQYRFFDIGKNHNYFDDFANRTILRKVADKCYLPTNKLMLDLIEKYGSKFKIAFSLSGTVMTQFKEYAPEVIESFRKLADTGCVEFLAETYAHSMSSLKSETEFKRQVESQVAMVQELFGKTPTIFRNTELIYSDDISDMVAAMGYKAQLSEGAKHIMGWRSPNYLYTSASSPQLKLLLKNFTLSDDIAFRFSNQGWEEWPLTTEKFVGWLNALNPSEEIVNLFMDYETFGEHQWKETGIFDFLRKLPEQVFENSDFQFLTPAEVVDQFQPISPMHVRYPISWADEERDLTAWLGNEMQNEAFDRLYQLEEKMKNVSDPKLRHDWNLLQTSDHFYYQCTKWFSDGDVHKYFNPYESPYDAFINFMNVLADFKLEVDKHLADQKSSSGNIHEEIEQLEAKIKELKDLKVP
ncbi:glycoside hydrolase family 57 protein [Membranicola marinus]|uniref:Glycoside hydrolase family 57 protein n=1 Tax=Membranihabitans marinus TaxID=1227546 RepID=A0A953L7M8_9BACT|nr:glycoside hydrolase family 57 protein [Membranihabitans marinus]MBY5958887.1 glycoside hydrolase family 57 protein [Membranihabitans marinus]